MTTWGDLHKSPHVVSSCEVLCLNFLPLIKTYYIWNVKELNMPQPLRAKSVSRREGLVLIRELLDSSDTIPEISPKKFQVSQNIVRLILVQLQTTSRFIITFGLFFCLWPWLSSVAIRVIPIHLIVLLLSLCSFWLRWRLYKSKYKI